MSRARHLGHERRELTDLGLAGCAPVQGIVESGHEELDRTPIAVDDDMDRISETRVVRTVQWPSNRVAHRPTRDDADSGNPVLLLPVAHEQVVTQSETIRNETGHGGRAVPPGLDEAQDVRIRRRQFLFYAGQACSHSLP